MISPPRKIIGVWEAQISDMAMWAGLGINTFVSRDQGADVNAWMAAAQAVGCSYIREPLTVPVAQDVADPYLLAWLHSDEPDAAGTPPATLAGLYAATLGQGKPWMVNFSGGYMLGLQKLNGQQVSDATYRQYTAAADWVGSDIYAFAGWTPAGAAQPSVPLTSVGDCLARLQTLAPGRRRMAFLETSSQGLSWVPGGGAAPTPVGMAAEAGQALLDGADICFFTIEMSPWKYNNTSAETRLRMKRIIQLALAA